MQRQRGGWSYPGLTDGLSVAIQSAARATSLEVFSAGGVELVVDGALFEDGDLKRAA